MSSPTQDVFAHVTRVAIELAATVRDSFGPMGKHVIVVDDLGKVSLTKNGLSIVTSLRCADPFAKMMVQAMTSHVRVHGDGSKTFIILFAGLLSSIAAKIGCNQPRVQVTKARRSLMTLRQFLWGDNDLFRQLFAERAVSLDGEKEAVTRLFSSILRSGSVLQQKDICERMADILVNLIYGTSNGCGHVTRGLVDYMLENFSHFVVEEVGRSIENSRLSSGFLLSRPLVYSGDEHVLTALESKSARLTGPDGSTTHRCHLFPNSSVIEGGARDCSTCTVCSPLASPTNRAPFPRPGPDKVLLFLTCSLTSSPSDEDPSFASELRLGPENLGAHMLWRHRRLAAVVRKLKDLRVAAIISQRGVLPFEAAELASAGIRCVEHLPEAEMLWLTEFCGCLPVSDVREILGEEDLNEFLVYFSDMTVVTVNGVDRVSIEFDGEEGEVAGGEGTFDSLRIEIRRSKELPRTQFILSAPTAATCESLGVLIKNCLRQLKTSLSHRAGENRQHEADDFQFSSPLLACGGFFEVFFGSIIRAASSSQLSSPIDGIYPFSSPSPSAFSPSFHAITAFSEGVNLNDETGAAAVPGSAANPEAAVLPASLNNGVGFLSDALLHIPSIIHRNSISSRKGRNRLVKVLNAFETSLLPGASDDSRLKIVSMDAKTGSLFRINSHQTSSSSSSSSSSSTTMSSVAKAGWTNPPVTRSRGHVENDPSGGISERFKTTFFGDLGDIASDPRDGIDSVSVSGSDFDRRDLGSGSRFCAPCPAEIAFSIESSVCDVESYEGKMAIVFGVLDLAIAVMNIEQLRVGVKSGSKSNTVDKGWDGSDDDWN